MKLTDLLPSIQKLQSAEKIKLIRILAEELETKESIYPLERNRTYDLPTSYNNYGVAKVLMETFNKAKARDKP